jgi:hypothetical protein
MLDEMSGKAGSVVYVKTKIGTIVRPRRTPANPNTPAQEAVRANLTKASRAYEALTPTQIDQWEAYAKTITKIHPITGEPYNPTGIAVFVALATKFLQVNPNGVIPLLPPAADFNGDNLTITVSTGLGQLTFSSNAANSANTKTELLVQRLRNRNRNPQKLGYRNKAFVAFAPGNLSANVPVTPGAYACAVRYVNTQTGQATELVPLTIQVVAMSVQKAAPAKKAA